jgi:hypothetical protein
LAAAGGDDPRSGLERAQDQGFLPGLFYGDFARRGINAGLRAAMRGLSGQRGGDDVKHLIEGRRKLSDEDNENYMRSVRLNRVFKS